MLDNMFTPKHFQQEHTQTRHKKDSHSSPKFQNSIVKTLSFEILSEEMLRVFSTYQFIYKCL